MANERDRLIGQRVHALIAAHLRTGEIPASRQIWVSTAAMFAAAPIAQNHAARQRAACATAAYFTIFHRPDWSFIGAELDLGTGRVDLAWTTPTDQVVVER